MMVAINLEGFPINIYEPVTSPVGPMDSMISDVVYCGSLSQIPTQRPEKASKFLFSGDWSRTRTVVFNTPASYRVPSILPSERSLKANLQMLPKFIVLSMTFVTILEGFLMKTYEPVTSPVELTASMVSDVVAIGLLSQIPTQRPKKASKFLFLSKSVAGGDAWTGFVVCRSSLALSCFRRCFWLAPSRAVSVGNISDTLISAHRRALYRSARFPSIISSTP